MSDLELKAETLEDRLIKVGKSYSCSVELVSCYLKLDRRENAEFHLKQCLPIYPGECNRNTLDDGFALLDSALLYWNSSKYCDKSNLRLNISAERKTIMELCVPILNALISNCPNDKKNQLNIKLSYVLECLGKIEDALGVLSELITLQPFDVDLSHVIFKAALLLSHIGGNNEQVIEYLEYLVDDPPQECGYGRTHVLALLATVYEKSGDHYAVVVEQTYENLIKALNADLEKGRNPVTNQKKLQSQLQKKSVLQSSEIFELLGVQAVDRCEYFFAITMLRAAAEKAPSKGGTFHLLAELHYISGNKSSSLSCAEKALSLQPHSSEIKALLLLICPEKWQEKLRTIPPSKTETVEGENLWDDRESRTRASGPSVSARTETHWLTRLTTRANDAIKDGIMAIAKAKEAAEARAKAAAAKEAKRKERAARRLIAEQAAAKQRPDSVGNGVGSRMRPNVPHLKPQSKPALEEHDLVTIQRIREQNENVHLYDPVLQQLAEIQEKIARDEKLYGKK